MTVLTVQAVLALALQCAPSVDPHMIVAMAQRESGLDPAVIHENKNGTRDWGLMQINETNFSLLHLSPSTALDACQSIRAAGDLIAILSRYNTGDPRRGIANGYAIRVMDTLDASRSVLASPDRNDQSEQSACARSPDVWADPDICQPPDQDFVQHYGDR